MKDLHQKVSKNNLCKIIFTDFFDTLIHRNVHPNYTLKLWAKFLVRELGLSISACELFIIRKDSLRYLAKKQKKRALEISYEEVVKEVYKRLRNNEYLSKCLYSNFKTIFEQADFISETSVQFKNDDLITSLEILKKKGFQIYLVTDIYLSQAVMLKILNFHQILPIFDDVFVSCELSKSKEGANIYPTILNKLQVSPNEVIMVGDNKRSDIINANKFKIDSVHTKNLKHHFRNKKNLFGSDTTSFKKACKAVERSCKQSKHQYSEYIINYYFFTERLYSRVRKDGIKDLFFLAREGLYLKTLFDNYQELNQIEDTHKINTHYLKASRRSGLLVSLKPLEQENFRDCAKNFGHMSGTKLLDWFLFSAKTKTKIVENIALDFEQVHENIFESAIMNTLREDVVFKEHYETNRTLQKKAFKNYLYAFKPDIESEGMALVDVGWGGTMQECIYNFLGKNIPVTGYYIGLKEIYQIEPNTKRFGLNFSLYPSHDISFDILKANGQLYEQLLGAPHGSTLGYTFENGVATTIEFYDENEKYVFDHYIKDLQEFMLIKFEELFLTLRPINYTQKMAQMYMTDMALRIGVFSTKKKIKFFNDISKGFYQNVGENKLGLAYSPKQLQLKKRNLIKTFLRTPEKVFRFVVKVKPYLLAKGFYWLSSPVNLVYYYMKFNFWIKKKCFPKRLL